MKFLKALAVASTLTLFYVAATATTNHEPIAFLLSMGVLIAYIILT